MNRMHPLAQRLEHLESRLRMQRTATELEAIADEARLHGDHARSERLYLESVIAAGDDKVLVRATVNLNAGDLPTAEAALRAMLRQRPTSIAAIRLMAMLALKLGREEDALKLLGRALDLAPGFVPARELRARTLQRLNRFVAALADADALAAAMPSNASFAMLQAALLVRLGCQEDAVEVYRRTLDREPNNATGWLSYAHVLKAIGRMEAAIAAYRRALALQPRFGEAWWSLANLKTFAFDAEDVGAMTTALVEAADDDRLHLHFALGKAHEDARRDTQAWAHYEAGNRVRRTQIDYRAGETTAHVDAVLAALSTGVLPGDDGLGWAEAGAIFVVGLPRSGSTLVEQILASHPAIEGTAELPEMMMIAERLGARARAGGRTACALLADLGAVERADLGREYMAAARCYRREDKPFFIDKMPNNWQHVALIAAVLPNARIIDVRRAPMAVGWAAYKQHFARGQEFTYDLGDLGRYYTDYCRMMAGFDTAHPGRAHLVRYERLVADTEGEIGGLLAHLGLPFDDGCLTFYDNRRTVRTPSAEQVRQPVFREGIDHWRRFEVWLGPLREALGPIAGEGDGGFSE